MTTTKLSMCIGAAVLAGVAIGMLFAPAKGSEWRGDLKGKANEILDKGKGLFAGNKEELKEKLI